MAEKIELDIDARVKSAKIDAVEKQLEARLDHIVQLRLAGASAQVIKHHEGHLENTAQRLISAGGGGRLGTASRVSNALGLGATGGGAEAVGALGSAAGAALTGVGVALLAVPAAAAAAVGSLKLMNHYVGSASPAAAERFNDVFEDFDAVIGVRLIPVVELGTEILRGLVDAVNDMLPSQKEMREAFEVVKPAVTQLVESVRAMAPLFRDDLVTAAKIAGESMRLLVIGFEGVALGAAAAAKALIGDFKGVRDIAERRTASQMLIAEADNPEQQKENQRLSHNAGVNAEIYRRMAAGENVVGKNIQGHEITKENVEHVRKFSGEDIETAERFGKLLDQLREEKANRSSTVGMKARQGEMVSGADLSRRAIIGALSTGKTPEEETAANTRDLVKTEEEILEEFRQLSGKFRIRNESDGIPMRSY